MDVVAESVMEVHDHRDRITGLEMTYEPRFLRFFQARFRPLVPAPAAERTATVPAAAASRARPRHQRQSPPDRAVAP